MNFFCIFTSCDFKRNNIEEEEFRKHLNEQHADEILVMEKGEIIERGNHSELISQKGVYQKLTKMQNFH